MVRPALAGMKCQPKNMHHYSVCASWRLLILGYVGDIWIISYTFLFLSGSQLFTLKYFGVATAYGRARHVILLEPFGFGE